MVVNSSSPQVFLFLSQVLGKKIVDAEGHVGGRVVDLVASIADLYPPVTSVLYLPPGGKKPFRLPWSKVIQVGTQVGVAPLTPEDRSEVALQEGELLLKDSLLDKQIVDTHGAKVLRVNDLHLLRINRSLFLVHVDVGFRGLMRRVGLERAADKFFQWLFDYHLDDGDTGVQVAQRLVQRFGARPCLILSADQTEAVRHAVQEAGLLLLGKPVRPLALKSVLDRLLAARAA